MVMQKKNEDYILTLVMMTSGGAIIPLIQGGIANKAGIHLSFIARIISYIYLLFYGTKGYKKIVGREVK